MGNTYVRVCVCARVCVHTYILKNHKKSTKILVIPMITIVFHLLFLLFSFILMGQIFFFTMY